jgi:hypothetical protein
MLASAIKASELALSLFHDNEHGCCIQSPILDLEIAFRVWAPSEHQAVQDAIRHISHDLWTVATITDRLEWIRHKAVDGQLHESHWSAYASADVEAIFVQLRSILDYSTAILDGFAPKRGQLPSSFRKLLDGLDRYRDRLPDGAASLLDEAYWFSSLRSARDAIVHEGGKVVVFCGPRDGILFQVYEQRHNAIIHLNPLMYNENVVHFDRFIAWQFSHILSYLDAIGRLFIDRAPRDPSIGPVSSYSLGFSLLKKWITELRSELQRRGEREEADGPD